MDAIHADLLTHLNSTCMQRRNDLDPEKVIHNIRLYLVGSALFPDTNDKGI